MTFLNLALLAGAATVVVPLLIHLLSRRRYTPVAWGAMFLIEQVVRQNRRRLRAEQWILLAIRCSIPILLALAMARPVLTGWRALTGDQPTSVVIVLDTSYSMAAPAIGSDVAADGTTAEERARRIAETVLSELPSGSDAEVILAGGGLQPLAGRMEVQPRRLAEAMGNVQARRGPVDASAAVTAAVDTAAKGRYPRRQVVFISDFQKLNWTSAATPSNTRGSDRPQMTFVRVDTAPTENAVVESLALTPAIAGVAQPVRATVRIRNAGTDPLNNLTLRLLVDDISRGESQIDLAAGASSDASFVVQFDTPGPHTLEAIIEGDAIPADSVARLAVNVPPSLPVVLVGGESGLPFPQNPTDFLQLALAPLGEDVATPGLIRPALIELSQLNAAAIESARVLVLANVPRLEEYQLRALRDFVETGGALLVFPGDRTDISAHNSAALFPARISALRGENGATQPAGPPYAHPALTLWNDPGNGRLADSEIHRWYALQPEAEAATIMRLETGEPMLVERTLGRGVIMLAALPADGTWSDLPLRSTFLPLVQQLVTYAASHAAPPRTVQTGSPLTLPLPAEQADKLRVVTPDGDRREVPVTLDRGRTVARYTDTALPGFYRFELPDPQTQATQTLAVFAVNAPPAESDLTALDDEELRHVAEQYDAAVVRGAAGWQALDRQRRYGREVWRYAWIALLTLLFGELLLQGWFSNRGTGSYRAPGGGGT